LGERVGEQELGVEARRVEAALGEALLGPAEDAADGPDLGGGGVHRSTHPGRRVRSMSLCGRGMSSRPKKSPGLTRRSAASSAASTMSCSPTKIAKPLPPRPLHRRSSMIETSAALQAPSAPTMVAAAL